MNKNYIEFVDIKIEDLHRWNEVEKKEAEDYMHLIYNVIIFTVLSIEERFYEKENF